MSAHDEPEVITVREARERLGVSRVTLARLLKEGRSTVYVNPLDRREKLIAAARARRGVGRAYRMKEHSAMRPSENTPRAPDGPTTTPTPAPERGPLTGLYFLSTIEPRQGQFLSPLGPEHYLVQLFDGGTGGPSLLTVVALAQIAAAKWHLYRDVEAWQAAREQPATETAAQVPPATRRASGFLRR